MTQSNNDSSNGWNLSSLWEKIKSNAIRFGRGTTRQVLLMYYVLKSEETPRGDKLIVYSALAYLILPINLISMRRHPIIGWFDEAASIAMAFQKIRQNITPKMEEQVDQTLDRWFAQYTAYEVVE